ncbi:glycerophosphodiester phosphodiesterase [Streptomyces solincola]|uniref:Glycerophosphodiester phosphodiesterase n=1 Tax=Streptomyces solincola TaxID=2100817 RepID=A0A2S9Q236_9ACTN|nr:glycerophosphodiester phosphodiesterase [Streptomyces solincola]PRH80731.1 glycerophosphodiester phosphodiesterase [Streptomyces solincola]
MARPVAPGGRPREAGAPAAGARRLAVVGHRGDPYRVRENTLASLRSAFAHGADAVETDVRLTRDGVPVLLHDDTTRRLWRVDRPLSALTLAELRAATGPEDGGVPTLAEALAATEGRRVMLDLPGATEESVRAVTATVRECGAADRAYYCSSASAMLLVRAADPAAEIALTWTSLAPPRPVLLDALAPRWLNYRFGLLSRALVDRVHGQGLLVSAWTADTRRTLRRLVAHGVDSVTTNRPDLAARVASAVRPPAASGGRPARSGSPGA